MPGFTAEVSLYKMKRHYQIAMIWADSSGEQIEPAQFLRPLPDGRPDGGWCKPHCSPCRPDPDSETGYSRCCTTIDCDFICNPCRKLPPPPPPPPSPCPPGWTWTGGPPNCPTCTRCDGDICETTQPLCSV